MWIDLPNIQILLDDIKKNNFYTLKNECLDGIKHVENNQNVRNFDVMNMGGSKDRNKFSYPLARSKELITQEVLSKAYKFSENNKQIMNTLYYHFNVKEDIKFYLDRLWINYQGPGEFFPAHPHSAFITFVIFINMPYTINKTLNEANSNDIPDSAIGNFEFFYNDIAGTQYTYRVPADKCYEGKILMFPGNLVHTVYPFYNNDWRITVSGNIRAKT